MGHARALVTINDPVSQLAVYNLILRDGLSVRKVEAIVKEINKGKDVTKLSIHQNLVNPVLLKKICHRRVQRF